MPSRAHGPEPCASANFATRAHPSTTSRQLSDISTTRGVDSRRASCRRPRAPPPPGFKGNPPLRALTSVEYASAAMGRALGLLDNFERGLERAVNGAFAKTFRSGLQPVEVTSALRRELDTKAVVVARDRILVPNQFTVNLSPADFDAMSKVGPSLIDEFILQVEQHATIQRYSFAGGISIALKSD